MTLGAVGPDCDYYGCQTNGRLLRMSTRMDSAARHRALYRRDIASMRGHGAEVDQAPLAPAHITQQRPSVNAPIQSASVSFAGHTDAREMRAAAHIERHGAGARLLAAILQDRR